MAGRRNSAKVATIAAPVGVTNSNVAASGIIGACTALNILSVAGAGTGNSPWAARTQPLPNGNGEA